MDAITLIETAAAPYLAAGYTPTDGEPGEWLELSSTDKCIVIEIDGADEDAEITVTEVDDEGSRIVPTADRDEALEAYRRDGHASRVVYTGHGSGSRFREELIRDAEKADARRRYEAQGEEAFDWNDDETAVSYGTPDDPFGINAPTVATVTYGPIGGSTNETRFTDLAAASEFAHQYRTSGAERIATVTYEGPHSPKHSDVEFAAGWISKIGEGMQIGYTAGSSVLCVRVEDRYRICTPASLAAGIYAECGCVEAAAVTMVLVHEAMERSAR